MNSSKKRILYIVGFALLTIFALNLLTQSGPSDLPGNFKEIASVRNENNTGPVIRRYVVSLSDTLWQEMEQYGNFMPHTKLGVTEVYFFLNTGVLPESVRLGENPIEEGFTSNCLAKYQKNASGQVSLQRKPFKDFDKEGK